MPKAHPKGFRDDVVAVARKADASIPEVARDFRISESRLRNWLSKADAEDGPRPGVTEKESTELRELTRRNRLLEQENEVLRRAAAYGRRRDPVTVTCQVWKLARQPCHRSVGPRELDLAYLANAVLDAHVDDREYGYRLLADEARRPARRSVTKRCGGSVATDSGSVATSSGVARSESDAGRRQAAGPASARRQGCPDR